MNGVPSGNTFFIFFIAPGNPQSDPFANVFIQELRGNLNYLNVYVGK